MGLTAIQTVFVTLASEQLQDLVMFYQGLLGQEPLMYRPGRYGEFILPGLRLALFKPSDGAEFVGAAGRMSLCIEVEDLVSAIATLKQLGYPPPGDIIHASHGQEIYAYDPDGNRLILHQSS
ncbi:glyoxalase [Leptolyngbya cf. ectocarpi LEGE 11479]|uniref:Glyoxalase n=1 Tax=Leptolyngbya cf. ectocarpi LEGE 11479 TaxID=1828722 RepID=A0A928ZT91_LEPEC|nr:VOC family protein [Leptolyngbya ectocarpi]MBE9066731.1 glyoxalase [Leptolyngbya cf. ectocarpi LEGE 11479]